MRAPRPKRRPGRRGDGSWSFSTASRWSEPAVDALALAETRQRADRCDPIAACTQVAAGSAIGEQAQPARFLRVCPMHLEPLSFPGAQHGAHGVSDVALCTAEGGHTSSAWAVVDTRTLLVVLVADLADGGEWLLPMPLAEWRRRVAHVRQARQCTTLGSSAQALLASLAVEQRAGQAGTAPSLADAPTEAHSDNGDLPGRPGGGGGRSLQLPPPKHARVRLPRTPANCARGG